MSMHRKTFLQLTATGALALALPHRPARAQAPDRLQPKVKRWDVVTVGNLARNPLWGENGPKPLRSTLCTCTLIRGEGFHLLVDPSLAKAEQMTAELDRRTGLKAADIDSVFVTHHHDDHWFGLAHFPDAKWFAAPEVADAINRTQRLPKPIEPASGPAFAALTLVPTPGHTASHHSLHFRCDGYSVVVAGDAVMTRDHWRERQGHHNSADLAQAAQTIGQISALADIVVPGHDNFFINPQAPGPDGRDLHR
jgi:glyoxylase-like metal-dependent hydrolase (beta-lactamase superfamily II)